mgnify:CR=1 FL=1
MEDSALPIHVVARNALFTVAFVCTSIATLLPEPAIANDQADCAGEVLSARLVACTRLITSGKLTRGARSEAYNNRGMGYIMLGEIDRGLIDFDKAIVLNPRLETAHLNRGYAHVFKNRLAEAKGDFQRAMKAKPDWAAPYIGRAIAHYMGGSSDRAIVDLTSALAIDPNDPDAYVNRGVLYREKGQITKAAADFKKAIGLDPFNKAAREQLKELFVKPDAEHRLQSGQKGMSEFAPKLSIKRGRRTFQCALRQPKSQPKQYACVYKSTN